VLFASAIVVTQSTDKIITTLRERAGKDLGASIPKR
jgi:hypothetical protein